MKTINLDLDGVVWDIMPILIREYNKMFNKNLQLSDYTCWNYLPDDEFWEVYPTVVGKLKEFEPTTNFLPLFLRYLNTFYNVVILTHGKYTIPQIKHKLYTLGIKSKIHYNKIIIEHPHNSKVKCKGEYYIDDNPHLAADIADYPDKTLLLFHQPWNKSFNVHPYNNIVRVCSWAEILHFFVDRIINDKYGVKTHGKV